MRESVMPKIISASEAKNRLGSVVSWVLENQDEVIVESRGAPTVVIMTYKEYEEIKALKERERRQQALERLRKLRDDVRARNQDLTDEEADALADRFSHEVIEDMVREGKIRFQE
jgi:prevent-host-death family protein